MKPNPPDDDFKLEIDRLRLRISRRLGWPLALILAVVVTGGILGFW